jgi:uncharacterized protein (UPF0333 family)
MVPGCQNMQELIYVTNGVPLSAYVGWNSNCKNMICMNNIKKFILYVLQYEVIENRYKMQATLNIQNAEHR